jgi:hypothetical protein
MYIGGEFHRAEGYLLWKLQLQPKERAIESERRWAENITPSENRGILREDDFDGGEVKNMKEQLDHVAICKYHQTHISCQNGIAIFEGQLVGNNCRRSRNVRSMVEQRGQTLRSRLSGRIVIHRIDESRKRLALPDVTAFIDLHLNWFTNWPSIARMSRRMCKLTLVNLNNRVHGRKVC